jgi:hypothetical protein
MKSEGSGLGPKGEVFVRFWVGLGFIAMGTFSAITNHVYEPGDIRGTQGFWVVLGLATVVIGLFILRSGVHMLRELRRPH